MFAERLQREAPVVPDDRRRAECDHAPRLLKPPAKIHIVARLAVFGVEPAYKVERPTVECHIAAGNVLRHDIREQNMARTARRRRHTSLHPVFRRGRNVRSPHPGEVAAEQRPDQVVEPVGVRHAIAVGINNHIARSLAGANIARVAEPLVFLTDVADPRMPLRDLLRVVGGPVIHQHDFVIGVIDVLQRSEAAVEGLRAVVGTNNDRCLRIRLELHARGQRTIAGKQIPDSLQRRLRRAVAPHKSERPIQNLLPAAIPLVGPRVDDRPRQPAAHHALDVPAQHLGLLLLGVPDRVHPEFTEDERLVLREVLQPGEVAVEVVLPVQVNIECREVAILRQQVFGGRITGIREQRPRVRLPADRDQFLDELCDLPCAEPANHRRWNLIADEVAENCRMPGVLGNTLPNRFASGGPDFRIAQEFQMLRPGDRHQHPDPPRGTKVQEPPRRDIINADEVDPRHGHHVEVARGFFRIPEMVARGIGRERTVGRPLDEKLLLALEKKLRADPHGRHVAHARTL